MNMDKVNEALAHLKQAELAAAAGFQNARTKLKEAVGDQNADGTVDVADVVIRAEQFKTGTLVKIGGWTLRDSKVIGSGVLIGYIGARLYPFVKPLLAMIF
jgi:hypothetical protein